MFNSSVRASGIWRARMVQATLHPGDALFVPMGWCAFFSSSFSFSFKLFNLNITQTGLVQVSRRHELRRRGWLQVLYECSSVPVVRASVSLTSVVMCVRFVAFVRFELLVRC